MAILRCINAIAGGNLIDDDEIQTRIGVDREALKQVASRWSFAPHADDGYVASNCMNEVANGLPLSEADIFALVGLTREGVRRVLRRLSESLDDT